MTAAQQRRAWSADANLPRCEHAADPEKCRREVDEWFGRRGKDGIRRWGELERDRRALAKQARAEAEALEQRWAHDATPAQPPTLPAQLEARLVELARERADLAELMTQTDEANARAAKRASGVPGTPEDGSDPDVEAGEARRVAWADESSAVDWHEGGHRTFRPRSPKPRAHEYSKRAQGHPCAESGCKNPVIGTAAKRYCEVHSTRAWKQRRYREAHRPA